MSPSAAASCARRHPGVGAVRAGALRASSTLALARSQGEGSSVVAYVADADEPTLHTVDVGSGREVATTVLSATPEQVLVLADGRVAVTLRGANGVEVLEPSASAAAPLERRCTVDVPTEPIALAETPDDATLLVSSGWAHTLTALDAATLAVSFEVDVPREPRAVVVSDDGTKAFVAHVVGARLSVVDLSGAKHQPRPIELGVRKIEAAGSGQRADGAVRRGCQGFALAKAVDAKDDLAERRPVRIRIGEPQAPPVPARPAAKPPRGLPGRVFAPMVSVDPGDPHRASSGYGDPGSTVATETGEVAVVDGAAERAITRSILATRASQPSQPECLLPRAAAYHDGALYVTCLGIDALVELDARVVDPARAELRRWAVPSGPTGIAIDAGGARAVVWSQYDREVAIVPLEDEAATPRRVSLSRTAGAGPTADLALGRRLFHKTDDPRISSDGRACASCHPDGREDSLTWSTPEGPRQTLMLAGRIDGTAPYGWVGAGAKLEDHVAQTFQRLEGAGLPDPDRAALLAYVASMAAPRPRALPGDAERATLVLRGHELFATAECSTCHDPDRGFTDGAKHDVRSKAGVDTAAEGFDTPSLRFVGGTAPYFHDGRYATLDEMLSASDHAMGRTLHLRREDRAALVAYLETL